MSKILILGAGTMGTALTVPLCQNGMEVNLLGTEFDAEILEEMVRTKQHIHLGIKVSQGVRPFPFPEIEKRCDNKTVEEKEREQVNNALKRLSESIEA